MRSVPYLEIVHQEPAATIGSRGALMVLHCRAAVTVPLLRTAEGVQERMLARNPNGTLLLTLIDASVPLPADGTRQVIADTFRKMAARNRAAATVVLGDGFWASAIRSTLTALNLIVRPPCPQRTFADIGEGLVWLGTFDEALAGDARPLARELDSLRQLALSA